MIEVTLDRTAAGAGVVFVCVTVAAGLLVGRPPDLDSPTAVATFLAGRGSRILWASSLAGLASFLFLWFLGAHQSFLRRVAPPQQSRPLALVALAGAVVTVVLVLVAGVVIAGSAVAVRDGADPSTLRALYAIALVCIAGATYPTTAVFVSSSSVALLASRTHPEWRWLGWFGIVLAAAQLAAGATVAISDGPFGLGGAYPSGVFLTYLAWTATTGLVVRSEIGH